MQLLEPLPCEFWAKAHLLLILYPSLKSDGNETAFVYVQLHCRLVLTNGLIANRHPGL